MGTTTAASGQRLLARSFLPGLLMFACLAALAPAAVGQPQQRGKVAKVALDRTAYHAGERGTAAVVLEVPGGFHAQSHAPLAENLIKFQVKVDKNDAATFGDVVYPPGKVEEYKNLGKLSVYTGTVVLLVPFELAGDVPPGELKLSGSLLYQLCDDSVCYPPERPKWSAVTKIVPKDQPAPANDADADLFKSAAVASPAGDGATGSDRGAAAPPPAAAAASGAPPVRVERDDAGFQSVMGALGAAFLAGILFNIVPCVLPVLPIKVLGFAEVAGHDRAKTILLATVFSAGIVAVFAVLGVLILVLKAITWGEQFANPYFAWGMVALLFVLSLWLFGVLNVNLPAGAYAFTPRHDTFVGNFQWGVLTAVLSTPCTGPLFVPVMGWATSQPQAVGVGTMMMVGVGMAFPYLMLSAFPGAARRFPRVGPWSELFKQMLGFVLLAFTVYFAAGRFGEGAAQWWAIVPVATTAALYLMARTVQLSTAARPVAISSIVSVGLVTAAVVLALRFGGGLGGDAFARAATARADGADASPAAVRWTPYSDEALAAARKANLLVLVKFTASWCLNCQYVEGTVFHDPAAVDALRRHDVVTLKADLTTDDAPGWPLLRSLLPTGGIPLTAIYAPGYDQPVKLDSVYTTRTLVSALDQLAAARTATAR